LQLSKKSNLKKENDRRKRDSYVPTITWSPSKIYGGKINSTRLLEEIKEPLEGMIISESQRNLMIQVINRLSKTS
jgi:hypothetical protein